MIETSSVNATEHSSLEVQQLAVVLALARAVLAAAEVQDERVVALQVGTGAAGRRSRRGARSRGWSCRVRGSCSSWVSLEAQPVDAREGGDVERVSVRVAPGQV